MAFKRNMSAEDKKIFAQQVDVKFKDFLGEVKELFVKSLEERTAPWQKPWTPFLPHNFTNHNEYKGENIIGLSIMLAYRCMKKNVPYDPRFCTPKAAALNHFKVKNKEEVYFAYFPYWHKLPIDPQKIKNIEEWKYFFDEEKTQPYKPIQLTKKHTLYNVSNLESDNIPSYEEYWERTNVLEWNKGTKIEEMIDALDIQVIHADQDRACYVPFSDFIIMPRKESFKSEEGYYASLLHEISHWTSRKNRLNRSLSTDSKSVSYAKEEVIAEMSAYVLSCYFGIRDFRTDEEREQSYTYTKGWLQSFTPENKIKAYDEATKEVDRIFNFLIKKLPKQEMAETEEDTISPSM